LPDVPEKAAQVLYKAYLLVGIHYGFKLNISGVSDWNAIESSSEESKGDKDV
jgi:hypothetical protein